MHSGLRRLVERIESAPKRLVTSADAKIQTRSLDRRLSPDIVAELVAAYCSGTSTNQLRRRYGISKGSVLKILADNGVSRRYQPMTNDEIDEAIHLYVDSGLSIRMIAAKLSKSKGSVWKALHERGRHDAPGSLILFCLPLGVCLAKLPLNQCLRQVIQIRRVLPFTMNNNDIPRFNNDPALLI